MTESTVTETPPDVADNPIDDGSGDREQTVRERFGDASGNVLRPTATDALGIDRVVGPPVTDWTPAPVEPDEDAVAAHEAFLARRAESREAQLDALTNPALVDDTAQPLIDANEAREQEHDDALASGKQNEVATTSSTPASQSDRTAEGDAGKTGDAERPKGEAKATGTTTEAKVDAPKDGETK